MRDRVGRVAEVATDEAGFCKVHVTRDGIYGDFEVNGCGQYLTTLWQAARSWPADGSYCETKESVFVKTSDPRPIVCGTDFSEQAAEAANLAAAMAKRLDTRLLLVHGVDERGELPVSDWIPIQQAVIADPQRFAKNNKPQRTMKRTLLILTMLIGTAALMPIRAEDQSPAAKPDAAKCEMMKKPAAVIADPAALERQAELERLVTEMNTNIGPKKIEAMAAILTRLVEQTKTTTGPAPAAKTEEGAKSEPHHH